jgi:hypothetical protein
MAYQISHMRKRLQHFFSNLLFFVLIGYRVRIQAALEDVWLPMSRIGGHTGYYYADGLWWLVDLMDLFLGGVELRRG